MTRFALNLPIDIPWRLVATSPDMMDTTFCNKRFPFMWRSSLAVSAFEPTLEDLPEEMCVDRVSLLKITCSVTGYQPTKEEVEQGYVTFPDVPTEDLQRILGQYFACYGALVNVAVFARGPMTRVERQTATFADRQPGQTLANPFQSGPFSFRATVPPNTANNRIVDLYPTPPDGRGELNLFRQLEVTFPPTWRVEAKVVHRAQPVTMEAYRGGTSIASPTTGPEQGVIHELTVEGEGIDRLVFKSPQNEASLVELAIYREVEVPIGLADYPHIVDFEPKVRDLYQAASEQGEVLTGSFSGVNTGKSFTHTENTQTAIGVAAKSSISAKDPATGIGASSELSGSINHSWGETDQERWAVQADASRDRRERHATSTSITQMYNLLTGYHAGTNRATFLMLPRPHMLQPTDHRTFAKGLRMIEGVQEFFLIVTRPRGVKGLSVEVMLETGHFPEKVTVEEPPVEYEESTQDFVANAYAPSGVFDNCVPFTRTHTVPVGWVIDRRPGKGDPNHPGVSEIANNSNNQANTSLREYNYQAASDSAVEVSGRICGAGGFGPGAIFDRTYTVFLRSEQPKPPTSPPVVTTPLLITSRALCAAFMSGETCVEPVAVGAAQRAAMERTDGIVDERKISVDGSVLAIGGGVWGQATMIRDVLHKIQFAMTSSSRLPSRRPFGTVGFLESDYFKDQIKPLLPAERREIPLEQVVNLAPQVTDRLGSERTVDEALDLDLGSFATATGLSVEDAVTARRHLLGLSEPADNEPDRGT